MTVLFTEFEFYNFNKFNQILVLDFNEIIERVTNVYCSGAQQGVFLHPALFLASSILGMETRCDNNKNNNTNDYLLTDYQV